MKKKTIAEMEGLLLALFPHVYSRSVVRIYAASSSVDELPLHVNAGCLVVFFDQAGRACDPHEWELAGALHVFCGKSGYRLELRAELVDIHEDVEIAQISKDVSNLNHAAAAIADMMEKLNDAVHL